MSRQDNSIGYHDHCKLIENFSRATYTILDKVGHNLQMEQDTVFTDLMKEWLKHVWEEVQ
jgi:pimeloyl-ACP methyl ester carboxylesterase